MEYKMPVVFDIWEPLHYLSSRRYVLIFDGVKDAVVCVHRVHFSVFFSQNESVALDDELERHLVTLSCAFVTHIVISFVGQEELIPVYATSSLVKTSHSLACSILSMDVPVAGKYTNRD
jgi:hypothetical protein